MDELSEQPKRRMMKNGNLVQKARELRKNMTREEKHLWYDFLRDYPRHFYRQKIIGEFIVDFYCADAHLVIEIDGIQHEWEENKLHDINRTEFLNEYGLQVLRFSNFEIRNNFSSVCRQIDALVKENTRKP